MDAHVKTIHTKVKEFKCQECDYESAVKGHLQSHIAGKHLKIKPYTCTYCSYADIQKSKLGEHIKAVHLKVKDLACPKCSYKSSRFVMNASLSRMKSTKEMIIEKKFIPVVNCYLM